MSGAARSRCFSSFEPAMRRQSLRAATPARKFLARPPRRRHRGCRAATSSRIGSNPHAGSAFVQMSRPSIDGSIDIMEPSSAASLLPCRLQYVASRVGWCPDDRCPLWQPSGSPDDGHCVFEELNVPDRSTFASWLVQLRLELQRARTANERNEVRRLFYRLLNQGTEQSTRELSEGLNVCRGTG